MAKQRLSRKMFNICLVAILIIVIMFVALMFVLNYDVNGESNMPFEIIKLALISTVNGQDVDNSSYKWDIDAIQNNDIYIYIDKNKEYSKAETIENVIIDEFKIIEEPRIGTLKIYKPSVNETALFQSKEENEASEIVFKGVKSTDTRNLEISNQGGTVAFRCANNNVTNFKSNDVTEINYDKLLWDLNITQKDLEAKISFNITIKLNSGKTFKAENVEVEIPNDGLIENGRVGREITDVKNIIFKRIEN